MQIQVCDCTERIKFMMSFFLAVMFAYEQGLLCLGHHPDMWIEAASYLEHSSRLLTEKGVFIYLFIFLNLIK